MNAHDAIIRTIRLAHRITTDYLSDLTDAELLVRPVPKANHIAWQLGHLLVSEHWFLTTLGANPPALPAGFAEAHSKDGATSDNPDDFLSKQQYMELFDQLHNCAVEAVATRSPEALDEPGDESVRAYAPTVGDMFLLIGQHELMHVGCYVPIRRKLEKPVLY